MKDPQRLIDQPPEDLAGSILRAGLGDEPSEHALRSTAAALGVGSALGGAVAGATASGAASSSAASGIKVGGIAILKWLGIGLVSGAAVAGGAHWLTKPSTHAVAATAKTAAPHAAAQPRAVRRISRPLPATPPEPEPPAPATAAPVPRPTRAAVRNNETQTGAATSPASTPTAEFASPPPATATAPAPPASLAADLTQLDRARQDLARGNGAAALQALATYEQERQTDVLAPEADVLRIRALLKLGQRARAAALARAFLAAHPTSSYAAELKPLVQSPGR